MKDGGRIGMRGYLTQTLIALLEALDEDNSWTSLTLEPNVDSNKVDILWKYPQERKAVQVKSSQNPFRLSDVKRWAEELQGWRKADKYELILVGQHASNAAAKLKTWGQVQIPPPRNLDLEAFRERAAHRLDRFLEELNLPTGSADSRELLAGALVERLATYSTQGCPVRRASLAKLLRDWVAESVVEDIPLLYRRHVAEPLTASVAIARLPAPSRHFVGRKAELALLDQKWEDPKTNIVELVALGGVGKSALVGEWLKQMHRDDWRKAERLFGYSFSSQGSRRSSPVSADSFLDAALRFFGDDDPKIGSRWDKGERLARLVCKQPTVLILDGIEPLQHPPTSGRSGELRDPGLAALVRALALHNRGLCIISSRTRVRDIEGLEDCTVAMVDLGQLPPDSGAALLRHLGVYGSNERLRDATSQVRGHGLALTLLGTYLTKAFGGDVARLPELELFTVDQRHGDHARHMMQRYESWFGESAELSILRLLGLFDRPATAGEALALRAPPAIVGLTEELVDLAESAWNHACSILRDCGLLTLVGDILALDAHPLIREYFAAQLDQRFPDAARQAHHRLYVHLKQTTPQLPDEPDGMLALYHAVRHGCLANDHQDAFLSVFWRRIQRGRRGVSNMTLSLFERDLNAISCFLDEAYTTPSGPVSLSVAALLPGLAGQRLRALGSLRNAIAPLNASFERYRDLGQNASNCHAKKRHFKWASYRARHLCELHLTLGDLQQSALWAKEALSLAEACQDLYQLFVAHAVCGSVLHHKGKPGLAHEHFTQAENTLRRSHLQMEYLYSLWGFRHCEFLFDARKLKDVEQRLVAMKQYRLDRLPERDPEIGIGAVGNALEVLLDAKLASYRLATTECGGVTPVETKYNDAVKQLRDAGRQDFIPLGLLARGAFFRQCERWDHAERDFLHALEMSHRCRMRLHEADTRIELARLYVSRWLYTDRDEARKHLTVANELILGTQRDAPQYPRRIQELQELQTMLSNLS